MLDEFLAETRAFLYGFSLFICPSIGQLADLVGMAISMNMLTKVP